MSLSSFLADSDSLSLLTPPGLPTRIDPVSGNPSTQNLFNNLCLGNGPLLLITITTGPYMGSDPLPVIIAFPSVPPPPPTSRRPRWSFKKGDLVSFQTELNPIVPPMTLPSVDKIHFLTKVLVTVGSHSHQDFLPFPFLLSPMVVSEVCSGPSGQAPCLYSMAKEPNPSTPPTFSLPRGPVQKCSVWAFFCASLSFSTSVFRAWSFFRKMVYPQPPFTFPLTSNSVLLTTNAQKAKCLATHIHKTLGFPDPVPTPVLPSSSHSSHEITTAITPQELTSTLLSLSTKKAMGRDDVPNERSTFLIRTYTKLASSPRYHALHSLLLRHSREPLHGPLPYQAHTPFLDRALSFFATLWVTPPPFLILEKTSLGPWCPLSFSVSLSLHTSTQWSRPYSPYSSTHGTTPTSTPTPTAPASLPLHPSVQPSTSPPGPLPLPGGYRPLPPSPQQNCSP
ncbi:hypothetical protein E2C01_054984 [Portunus trituberculatus]|uniref:Uncharacterized protein n=1 Tax=Portunus trituberculatus TaxID=210409 RepID=A0A5B7GWF2_PORTR|nr:hypothetical protein [Portunus trituberculatus]